ncbi:isochorismate synthase DhbC [Niallia sp. NCCP-28]|uniref:isochorismate synthase DhbC n=1 Tax=Niallia sp. NCCP-28 TaxID=2934712 RepID=UPI0020807D95|nr:isochorismate synthase DhbC [Niallia sp. NCCP-28]GKU83916.1 isochorismate synthase DhbC [Niallia sp. NCCP-28]
MNKVMMPADVKDQLLNAYEEGDFYLSSPSRTMLGKGVLKKIFSESEEMHQKTLSEQVKMALEEARQKGILKPVAVGAIPFDPKNAPQLIIPERTKFSVPHQIKGILPDRNSSLNTYDMRSIPKPEEYMDGVHQGLTYIQEGELEKIVLARTLRCQTEDPVDTKQILQNLVQYNAGGYTFAVNLLNSNSSKNGKDPDYQNNKRTFMGASPELLVSRAGTTLIANPLAGSRPRSEDPVEDRRRAMELLVSAKDLHEHAVVVDAVSKELAALCTNLVVPDKPSVVQTETMWHLSTEIKGEIVDSKVTSLDLALALHPTPAVCGYPTERAYEAINEVEPFDRNYFTGIVGWCDESGDGEWIVAIRCAEIEKSTISLYAGAGVVAGSKPEEELEETSAKFRTMLYAMGLKGLKDSE